ncbi:MAG TPA: phosphate signaling complex protein PhoU [Acidimicrobiales bacterium]|nr:phosphate signaling complex protein PhoU [Acidimicrobiales bacterium]
MTETRKAFHEELDEVRNDVTRLGAMVLESIQGATAALLEQDLTAGEQVLRVGRDIDALRAKIEDQVFHLLAQQQPLAVDLRTLFSILRVIHELELSGHLMVNTIRASRRLYPQDLEPRVRGIIDRMREQATVQLQVALDAFAELDATRAAALEDMNAVMDDLQKDLFRAILTTSKTDEAALQLATQMALVGRFFERTADHAVTIGERVVFMVTGRLPTSDDLASAALE